MSETIITTRSLGYSIDPGKDETDFVARLINPGTVRADLGFFDEATGVLSVYTKGDNGKPEIQFDSGYPTEDFVVSMRNYRRESGIPVYEVVVEELGLSVAKGSDIDSPAKQIHRMSVISLEQSPIIAFSQRGYDADEERYEYSVTLENGCRFTFAVRSSRSPIAMADIEFDENQILIDKVPYSFFGRHMQVVENPETDGFAELITKRIEFLRKIYYTRKLRVNLDNLESKA
jgi:hypothetical protein